MQIISSGLQGFFTGASLIIAIGAQNAFVLKQGLSGRYLFLTALICSLIDAGLISVGVLGFASMVNTHPLALQLALVFSIVFLFLYGCMSFKSAFSGHYLEVERSQDHSRSLAKTIMIILTLSLLNPHVYLDTVVLIGSVAAQLQPELRCYFALGAMMASFLWFFSLIYGARQLRPFLKTFRSWKVIDCLVGMTMWSIAFKLILS